MSITNGLSGSAWRSSVPKSAKAAIRSESVSVPASKLGPLKRWLKPPLLWFYNHVYTQLYWPDDAFLWYLPAVRKVRGLSRSRQYDAIISVSLYFTGQLVGEQAHRINPDVPWLVDIGDPFAPMDVEAINNRFYSGLNYRTEARILQRADAVAVTTPGTKDIYGRVYPDTIGKITVIPPLLSTSFESSEKRQIFADDGQIRLVFTGMLYATVRRPDFLLSVFRNLLQTSLGDQLELHFFGYTTQVQDSFTSFQNLLGSKIFLHGTVSREQAQSAIAEADVLVNIGNTTSYQLPSKVVEYMATGKRILNIAQIDNDSSAAFFENYTLAITLLQSSEPDEAAEQLYDFLVHAPSTIPQETLAEYLKPFTVETIAQAYEGLLKKDQT